jgi:hypothetical protein
MPQKPRRRLTRRNAPPRPTYAGAQPASDVAGAGTAGATATATSTDARGASAASSRRVPEAARPAAYVERQTPYLRSEMRRVGVVSAVCFGMLAVLAVVDRLQ